MRKIVYVTLVLLCFSAFAAATNQVVVTAWGNIDADTIRSLITGSFAIAIENDAELEGISLGFILSGTAPYHFENIGEFQVNPSGPNFLYGIPGSRWMNGAAPDGSCWDLGGTQVTYDPEGGQPYQFLISGTSLANGLAPGPLQDMLQVFYTVDCWFEDENPRTLCIDSLTYPPAGDFIFMPGGTPSFYVANGINGCFPVSNVTCAGCPQWDENNPTSMTVHAGGTGQVTLSATDPEMDPVYYYLVGVTGGAGTATVGPNDGVVTYEADPADVGADIQIMVEATDPVHQKGGCAYFARTIDVTVTNNPPVIDCGNSFNMADAGTLFKKFDVAASDPDSGDDIRYRLYTSSAPAGFYSIDTITGVVSFYPVMPDDNDSEYEFCVEASDGIDAVSCCFHIYVCTCEDYAGDADGSGDVNIGDAVTLIYYIFKGSGGPVNMNWADVNADCDVNIADVVYLIDYIFKGGPTPQLGCYY